MTWRKSSPRRFASGGLRRRVGSPLFVWRTNHSRRSKPNSGSPFPGHGENCSTSWARQIQNLAVIRRLRFGENYSPSRRIDFENFERETYRMFGQGELHGTPLGPPTPEVALEASRRTADHARWRTDAYARLAAEEAAAEGLLPVAQFRRACRSRSSPPRHWPRMPNLAPGYRPAPGDYWWYEITHGLPGRVVSPAKLELAASLSVETIASAGRRAARTCSTRLSLPSTAR